jgi:hypothetical protein
LVSRGFKSVLRQYATANQSLVLQTADDVSGRRRHNASTRGIWRLEIDLGAIAIGEQGMYDHHGLRRPARQRAPYEPGRVLAHGWLGAPPRPHGEWRGAVLAADREPSDPAQAGKRYCGLVTSGSGRAFIRVHATLRVGRGALQDHAGSHVHSGLAGSQGQAARIGQCVADRTAGDRTRRSADGARWSMMSRPDDEQPSWW